MTDEKSPDRNLMIPSAFLEAARTGRADVVGRWLDEGFTAVNYAEPETGLTALHYAAARNAVPVLKRLVASGQCNYALRDRKGRTAATLAIEVADNPAIGRYLYDLEFRQTERAAPGAGTARRAI